MSYVTPNLGLVAPEAVDDIDATVIASNFDKIDTALQRSIGATVLAADFVKNNTTATSPVGSGVAVKAGRIYLLRGQVNIQFVAANNIAFSLSGPTLSIGAGIYSWYVYTATGSSAATVTTSPISYVGSSSLLPYQITGLIAPTTSGLLQLNVGQNAAVASNLTVKAGSILSVLDVT